MKSISQCHMIIISSSTYDNVKKVLEKTKDFFILKFAGFNKGENTYLSYITYNYTHHSLLSNFHSQTDYLCKNGKRQLFRLSLQNDVLPFFYKYSV